MSRGLIFWIMLLLWFLSLVCGYVGLYPAYWHPIVNSVFLFLLFLLVGWQLWGAPIKG